jgi:hypothetical protein
MNPSPGELTSCRQTSAVKFVKTGRESIGTNVLDAFTVDSREATPELVNVFVS